MPKRQSCPFTLILNDFTFAISGRGHIRSNSVHSHIRYVFTISTLLRKQTEGPKIAGFDFIKAHDVLRHILQYVEVLKAATDVFSPWLERYKADQTHQAGSEWCHTRLLCAQQGQNGQNNQSQDQFDTDIA